MRRDRYVQQFAEHIPRLRKLAMQTGLNYDAANEVIGKCAERLLSQKKYVNITPRKLKSFLRTHLNFSIQHYKRDMGVQMETTARIPEPDERETEQNHTYVTHSCNLPPIEEQECPFCFQANLNQYGACAMCHTILPSERRLQRKVYSVSKESLTVEFDFNTSLDVQKAVARLTPYEQRLVRAIGLGNDSLESFAFDNQVSKTSLVRTWVLAKTKLQDYLKEYSPKTKHRSPESFRKAIYACPKQVK